MQPDLRTHLGCTVADAVRVDGEGAGCDSLQILWSPQRSSRHIEHVGSAYDDAGLELLRVVARQW